MIKQLIISIIVSWCVSFAVFHSESRGNDSDDVYNIDIKVSRIGNLEFIPYGPGDVLTSDKLNSDFQALYDTCKRRY